jgi:hypothetical protein
MTTRWNTQRIALYGALVGVALPFFRALIERDPGETDADWAGLIFGSALGGAILFAVVSGARNLIRRAR